MISLPYRELVETPYEILKKLTSLQHKTDKLSKINYLTKMLSTPMENPNDPATHFKVWKNLIAEASNHGVNDTDLKISDIISMLCLRSIHKKYDTVITVIESNASINSSETKSLLSIEEIESHVMSYHARQDIVTQSEINSAQANPPHSSPNVKKFCDKCKWNHFGECAVQCSKCGRKHFSKFCKCSTCNIPHAPGSCQVQKSQPTTLVLVKM